MESLDSNKNQVDTLDDQTDQSSYAPASYEDYWPQFITNHRKLISSNRSIRDVAEYTNKSRARMEDRVNQSWADIGIDSSTEARSFYFRLGSLNSLEGCEEVLAKAGMVMQRRSEVTPESDDCTLRPYESLVAGCLFYEAGLVVGPGRFRESMFSRALSSYNGVIDSSPEQGGFNPQRAIRYSYDIQFQRVFDALAQDRIDDSEAGHMHAELQETYIMEFLNYLARIQDQEARLRQQMRSSASQAQRKEIGKKLVGNLYNARGLSLEWFSLVAYRRFIDKQGLHRDNFIRSALPREEEPWFFKNTKDDKAGRKGSTKQMPKHGFDIAVMERKDAKWQFRPIQLKLGKGSETYLPEIEMVGFAYENPDGLLDTLASSAQVILKEYRNQPLAKKEQEVLKSTTELFNDRLLAA